MNAPEANIKSQSSAPHPVFGYRDYKLGQFEFRRDEYFAHIRFDSRFRIPDQIGT